ncbi:MAG: IPT/TIG domain-containing protein [Gemmatimonadota bacterium]
MRNRFCAILALAALLNACGGDSTGPDEDSSSIAAQTNEVYFGTRNSTLLEPLQAIVTDPVTKLPKRGVTVSWQVVEGTGTLTAVTSVTDGSGVASMSVRLGNQLGTTVVAATVPKQVGSPARFMVRAVEVPSISSIAPPSARAGDTVTITGQNFSPVPAENVVLFSGFRGKVVSASATQLRAVVPLCVPSRTVTVQPLLGAVAGHELSMEVTGITSSVLELQRGEARTFSDPNELACFRLPGGVAGLSVLLVPQNFSEVIGSFTAIELSGLTGTGVVASVTRKPSVAPSSAADAWELRLRRKERELLETSDAVLRPQSSPSLVSCQNPPVVGSRCDFLVLNKQEKHERVTAELKAISARALVYQDVNTPLTGGLTTEDFNDLGAVFDNPIYATEVAVFGAPSDIDKNDRVFILLTPVVNALTARGSSGFIAGFFFGCDLLPRSKCDGSNEAEIFYALTTDPGAKFSDARSRGTIMKTLPAVIAHEFQHMINFAQRGGTQDALWLSEGMAHHAEDVVADAFEATGQSSTAAQFRTQNTTRANRYLRATSAFSLLASDDASSLELRGAAWLFVKYLAGQYGDQILAKLTRSTLSSVSNVTAQTGKAWSTLLAEWSVALWADEAPELAGVSLRKELTFPNMDLRQRMRSTDGTYPLKPSVYDFMDFIHLAKLPASSQDYVMMPAGSSASTQLSLSFSGQRGGAFATSAAPQMTVLRIN